MAELIAQDPSNPWVRKSTSDIYENRWIRIWEDKVLNPSGNDGIYGVVSFKNFAIAIIPIDNEGFTWLVGQYRYPINEYSWEVPMGGGPKGVDVLESAKRELKEETGLEAEHWEMIMRIHTSNSVTDEEGFVFLAKGLTQLSTEFEETEKIEIAKVPFATALELVMEQKITDALSIAGILKAARILGY